MTAEDARRVLAKWEAELRKPNPIAPRSLNDCYYPEPPAEVVQARAVLNRLRRSAEGGK